MLLVYSKDSVKFSFQAGEVNPCELKERISGTLFLFLISLKQKLFLGK